MCILGFICTGGYLLIKEIEGQLIKLLGSLYTTTELITMANCAWARECTDYF